MTRQLSMGLSGEDVKQLQNALNTIAQFKQPKFDTANALLKTDGIFGVRTKARVVEFQSRNNIVNDGIVGAITMNLINLAMDVIKKLPAPPPPVGIYKRMFAIIYARMFHDKITSDGRIATKTGYPRAVNGVNLTPGLPFSQIGAIAGEEDCTHFISCCIGRPPPMKVTGTNIEGGGLPLQTAPHVKQAGAYGRDTVPEMVPHLISAKLATVVGPQFQPRDLPLTKHNILTKLQPGDLIAYASKDKPANYEHLVILVGPTAIACHTRSRFGPDFDTIGFPWVTLLRLP